MQYRILSADFMLSVKSLEALLAPDVPEAAFIGRSNCGKSSLINLLCGRKGLAKTSSTPGRTQALNFFKLRIGERDGEAEKKLEARLVDLPGYGYAKVKRTEKAGWQGLIEPYLMGRGNLRCLVLLMDIRRPPEDEERWVVAAARSSSLLLVLTKADKVNRNEAAASRRQIASELGIDLQNVHTTSTIADRSGADGLLQALCPRLLRQ